MKDYTPSRSPCPVGRASRLLGDRWVLLILREAFLGIDRFEDFIGRLDISRAALTSRLGWMVAAGVLERVPPQAKRARYRLTPAGEALRPTYDAIKAWGDAWLPRAHHADAEQGLESTRTAKRRSPPDAATPGKRPAAAF